MSSIIGANSVIVTSLTRKGLDVKIDVSDLLF